MTATISNNLPIAQKSVMSSVIDQERELTLDETDDDDGSETSSSTDSSNSSISTPGSTTIGSVEEGDLIVDDEDDYASTLYTDESSTTSTSSTTNNQQDSTRVCDCCYCEVFGHGSNSGASTSRNFQEMRERLRKRLSKRREEKCRLLQCAASNTPSTATNDSLKERDGENEESRVGGDTSSPNKSKNQTLMGDSNIDEILNFINGTSQDRATPKKKDKNKIVNKKKKKNKSTNTIAKDIRDSDRCNQDTNQGHNSNHSTINQNKSSKFGQNSPTLRRKNLINQHYQSTPNTPKSTIQRDLQPTDHKCKNNHKSCPDADQKVCHSAPQSDNKCLMSTKEGQRKKDRDKPIDKSKQGKQQQSNIPHVIANKKLLSTALHESSKANRPTLLATQETASESTFRQRSTAKNVNFDHNGYKHDSLGHANDTDVDNSCQQNNVYISKIVEPIKNRDSTPLMTTVPDDIFIPHNIDLDDAELDEIERELEAFKRFCFDSIALVKKERVRIELKDSHWFEIFEERSEATSKLIEHSSANQDLNSSPRRERERGIETM